MNAYFVTCTGFEALDDGTVTAVHCTYDPETKGGNAPDGRKVKGTIHWVEASNAGKVPVRLYENIVDEEKGVYDKETGELNLNPNSLIEMSAYVEPELLKAKGLDSYQFVRNGFYCADIHDSKEGAPVFNRIVSKSVKETPTENYIQIAVGVFAIENSVGTSSCKVKSKYCQRKWQA